MAAKAQMLLLLVVAAACAQPGCARVHEVLWDVPADGLQLPSISTVKCGDVIRFKCPAGAAHGVYKLAATNYNGTCPQAFDAPAAGEVLAAPAQGCDFSLTVTDDMRDFFITSHTPGACGQNLKVSVHAVCPTTHSTYASEALAALSQLPADLTSAVGSMLPTRIIRLGGSRSGATAGSASSSDSSSQVGPRTPEVSTLVPGLDAFPQAGSMLAGSSKATLGGRATLRRAREAEELGLLESARQNGGAASRPVLEHLAAAAVAAALCALAQL